MEWIVELELDENYLTELKSLLNFNYN